MRTYGDMAKRAEKMALIVKRAAADLVTAGQLAEEIGADIRTIYRYVAQIRATGVDIRGEAGMGYRVFNKDCICPHCGSIKAKPKGAH